MEPNSSDSQVRFLIQKIKGKISYSEFSLSQRQVREGSVSKRREAKNAFATFTFTFLTLPGVKCSKARRNIVFSFLALIVCN